MDKQDEGLKIENNQQIQSQHQATGKQRSERILDNQQIQEKKCQSESKIPNKTSQPQSMETTIQRQQNNEPNNYNEEKNQQILDQQNLKAKGDHEQFVRSNQTTLTTLPQSVKQQIDLIDNEKASKLLLQYQEEQDDEFIDLISELKIDNQKPDEEENQNQNLDRQQNSDSESEYDWKKKLVIVLPDNVPKQTKKRQVSKQNQIKEIKIEDAQFIDQQGKPIGKLDIFKQNGSVMYNPQYKFYRVLQQNQIQTQMKQNEPQPSSIIMKSIYPEDDIKSESDCQSNNEKEQDKEQDKDKESDQEVSREKDDRINLEEEQGRPILKQRRQKEFAFLEPQDIDKKSRQRIIIKLSEEELKMHTKQRYNREAIQYERNQKLKQQLRKENGTDNIAEETIEEKCLRLTSVFERKLQILPSDDIMESVQYLRKSYNFRGNCMNAMDQQRAIWLKHGFIGHLKPKPGFRFHQLYEKTNECLIDEDDPYGMKSPFVPQPEDRIKFERLHQLQLKDSTSLASKNQLKQVAIGGQTMNNSWNQAFTNNLFLQQASNNAYMQQQNPFISNQNQNNQFQNNPLQNTLFQNNLVQNNPFQNNLFQSNPQQNNIQNIFSNNNSTLFQNNQQNNLQQNNPFLTLFQPTGNQMNTSNQPPIQNIFGVNNQVPNIFNRSAQNIFGVNNNESQGRPNNIPQTFKQSQSPMRYRVNSYQNNINQQTNWNQNQSAFQQPIKNPPSIFQTNLQGQAQQPFKQAYNPFQPPPIANQQNNVGNKVPDIFQPKSNLNIPSLQNIFQQNQPQIAQNQGTNRYNTRSNNRINNFR